MSKPFTDKIKVHSTKSGQQFIKVSDLIRSEEFKRDKQLIREAFIPACSEPPPISG